MTAQVGTGTSAMRSIEAEPYPFEYSPATCALLLIDMQRDFLEPGGFGEMLGNDVSKLRSVIEPNQRLLAAWRGAGLQVLHTREGHRPDLSCLPPAKKRRGRASTTIGDAGPLGRILVRGEAGHDIIPDVYPWPTEAVIDKPGKGGVLRDGSARDSAEPRDQAAHRHRGDDGSVREHDGSGSERPWLRLSRTGGLRGLLFPGAA